MALFYADENFDYPVTQTLQALGHDVLTVPEGGEKGGDDARVLTYARAMGLIVLTFDRRDFERLHRATSGDRRPPLCFRPAAGFPGCCTRWVKETVPQRGGSRRFAGTLSTQVHAAEWACRSVPHLHAFPCWRGQLLDGGVRLS